MHTKRNVLLAAFAMALIGAVVWIFVTAAVYQYTRYSTYQDFAGQLVNTDTGELTTPIALFVVSSGVALLISAVVMVPISAVVLGFVAAKSNATTPLDYTQGIETTQQVR